MIVVLLLVALILMFELLSRRQSDVKVVHWSQPLIQEPPTPEFRPPPMKQYKPKRFQQMGLLTNDEGDILPLYGKETSGHRDRYHYYTTTPGQQVYSVPITHKDRDCLDDVGCEEFYGKAEDIKVEALGESPWKATIYNTKNMF